MRIRPMGMLILWGLVFAGGGLKAQSSSGKDAPHSDQASAAVAAHARMAPKVRVVFDSVFADLEQYHLYRAEVDWAMLRREALLALDGRRLDSVQQLAPALQLTIDRLRDHHGRFIYQQQPIAYFQRWDMVRHRDPRPRDPELARPIGYAEYPHMARLLPGGVAYLRVGTVSPYEDPNAVARRIRRLVDSVHALQRAQPMPSEEAYRWMVDLRYNGGGNIFPMATGIAPLFEQGPYGHTLDPHGDTLGTWRMNPEGFERDGYQPARLAVETGPLEHAYVACLMGRYTVSSGEILAVGFAARQRSRLFGEASGGYTTETNWAPYRGGLLASYAVSRYADKHGQVYDEAVPPDVLVPEPEEGFPYHDGQLEALETDPVVQAALRWLASPEADD